MAGRVGRLFWAAAAAASVVAACGRASRSHVRAVGGDLAVQPAAVDFGDVALGRELATQVTVRNDGVATLNVESLGAIDPAFVVSGLPVKLAPGKSSRVEVRYRPPALGTHQQTLSLMSDALESPRADVYLRGRAVRGLAQMSGDVLDFGDVVVGELSEQSFSLTNNDGHAETSVTIDSPQGADADAFQPKPTGKVNMGPDQVTTVTVDFTPSRLGDFGAHFQVTPCPTCSARDVTLAGHGVDRLITVEPAAIDFGDVALGAVASKPFTIANTSRNKVTVNSLTLSGGADLAVALDNVALPYTFAPGEVVTATAFFKPRALGAQNATATMPASDGGPGTLSLAGLGMGPVVQVRPKSLYLGATATGTTRTAAVTVSNVGLDPHQIAPLTLNGISLDSIDAAWSVTPASEAVGEPGSSAQIQISFSPSQAGTSNATLVILSNDGMTPRLEVPMTALGRDLQPCTLSVSPASPVDFGAVPLFHPSTQGFELTNQTGDDCIVGDPVLSGGPAFRWPGGITPTGRTLPSGGRMSVRIEFVPEAAQTYAGDVRFYVSNKSAPSLDVALQGEGDASCFYLSPGAVDFGAATQGCATPDQTAYAVNHCGQPVTVTDVHTSGPPFFVSQAVPFTVQPQTSASITVSYRAATPGDDVGSLSVTASTRATPYQIGLTGGSQPAADVIDQWDQSTPKVDLLMIIDNSGSMANEQHALAANLDHLWNRIALANADFHIAITTSGMEPYTQGWTQCPGGATGGEAGRFFPVDATKPRILTPSTAGVKDALFANTNVGLCHWDERFLEPAVAALTAPLVDSTKAPSTPWPSDGNAGFLRDDARLALLVITDTDDDNKLVNPPPVSGYVNQLIAVKHGAKDLVSFAAVVPLEPCQNAETYPTPRFTEAAAELNGHLYDACNLNDFGTVLENAAGTLLLPLTSFALSTLPRDPAAIAVSVNGAAASNWSYSSSANRIVFPADSVPAPGSHISAEYEASCR